MTGHVENDAGLQHFQDQVRTYYDQWNAVILEHFGSTYQTALFRMPDGRISAQSSNECIGRRAGLKPGDRVLDAGCGSGGPAIDIVRAIPGLTIEGITISPAQAASAQAHLEQARIGDRVRVQVGDFHRLPFADGSFDAALMLEVTGYSQTPDVLFRETERVLGPEGRLYIKGPYVARTELDASQRAQLDAFNAIYAWATPTFERDMAAVAAAGFTILSARSIMGDIDTKSYGARMFVGDQSEQRLSSFGQHHHTDIDQLPLFFAEIVAVKRSYASRLFG